MQKFGQYFNTDSVVNSTCSVHLYLVIVMFLIRKINKSVCLVKSIAQKGNDRSPE